MVKIVFSVIGLLACLFIRTKEGSAYLLDPDCAVSRIRGKIMGGRDTDILSNPWMVLVIAPTLETGVKFCGGFVLTAAHCIKDGPMKVRLGEYDNQYHMKDCSSGICIPRYFIVDVDRKMTHKEYNGHKNDIGILRMSEIIPYSDFVRPICILIDEEMGNVPLFSVTGWGGTRTSDSSKVLQVATLENFDRNQCAESLQSEFDVGHICAGSYTSDSCNGDSGGPLSAVRTYEGHNRTFQYGIVSFGLHSCGGLGVYTNVTHFTGFILRVLEYLRNT
ncbi:phenoloxidase-activating enzyme-like isoform X2 [Drosophila subpulchrella]|uniref:phenoloxidase-activating enzyme-like isoform X2 n=1 Tax=Drosophila subpulchrella TaxID=1486046 RepID=UPI0018A19CAC|nr:phenoloxidase-activating enzyme-like isoform X2 [Drosophila subpulchrella]